MIINAVVSAEEMAPLYDDLTPCKISSFAASLTDKGEYYRAYVELLRLNSYYPSSLDTSVFEITSNYLFYKSKKYDELLKLNLGDNRKDYFKLVSLFRIDSLIKLDRKDQAESELLNLYNSDDSNKYDRYLMKRSVYLSIVNHKKSKIKFKDYSPGYDELFLYSENIYNKRKNPLLGALAGIIPGMGYLYAGERGTSIISIIVIGAGSAVTYASYRKGLDSLAIISGLITFFFYGGSVAGGYMQSVKYNNRLMDTLEMRLDRELMPERDLEEIYFKFGLSSNACK